MPRRLFLTLALAQIWNVFNLRDPDAGLIRNDVTGNPYVWGAIAICLGLIATALWLPALAGLLRLDPPGAAGLGLETHALCRHPVAAELGAEGSGDGGGVGLEPGRWLRLPVAGQGGRGRVPGTVEELGVDGLVRRYIAGHTETARSMLSIPASAAFRLVAVDSPVDNQRRRQAC